MFPNLPRRNTAPERGRYWNRIDGVVRLDVLAAIVFPRLIHSAPFTLRPSIRCRASRARVSRFSPRHGLGAANSLCCRPLDRRHVIVALLPSIQHVRPLLHHLGAVAQVFGVIVSSPHRIRFGMGQLSLDPVGRKTPTHSAACCRWFG